MGVTIHYRGTVDDIRQIEMMEDRIFDLVIALGGRATAWRSFASHDASRIECQEIRSQVWSPQGQTRPARCF